MCGIIGIIPHGLPTETWRGGRVVMISDAAGVARLEDRLAFGIAVPRCDPFVAPLLYAIPIQLLAYHVAVLKGTDVD